MDRPVYQLESWSCALVIVTGEQRVPGQQREAGDSYGNEHRRCGRGDPVDWSAHREGLGAAALQRG